MSIELFKYILWCGIDGYAYGEFVRTYGAENNPEREYAYALYLCESIDDTYYLPEKNS